MVGNTDCLNFLVWAVPLEQIVKQKDGLICKIGTLEIFLEECSRNQNISASHHLNEFKNKQN